MVDIIAWHVCVSLALVHCSIVQHSDKLMNVTLNTPHGTTIIFYFNVCIKFSCFFFSFFHHSSLIQTVHMRTERENTRTCSLFMFIDKVELLSHLFSLEDVPVSRMSIDCRWGAKNFKDK